VLKVFASPRARGNVRRIESLRRSSAGHLVPEPWGVDDAGHVSLVAFVDGQVFDCLDDDRFVATAELAGLALRELHDSAAMLDRTWTLDDELRLLVSRATTTTRTCVDLVVGRAPHLLSDPLVSAHRDCHPRQLVTVADGVCWIDLDDAAMAPSGLDVGNMVAHLRRDAVLGRRSPPASERAIVAFRSGYGETASDVDGWEQLSLLRLAGLAETRDRCPADARHILSLIELAGIGRRC
jgi:Ser/Thr protein kinase RdoA (MazF antagonist)